MTTLFCHSFFSFQVIFVSTYYVVSFLSIWRHHQFLEEHCERRVRAWGSLLALSGMFSNARFYVYALKKKKSSYTFLILSAGKHQQLVTTCKSHILHSASPLPRWHTAHFLSPPRHVFSVYTPSQPSVSFSLLSSSPISPHPSLPSGLSHRQQHAPKSFSQTVSQ